MVSVRVSEKDYTRSGAAGDTKHVIVIFSKSVGIRAVAVKFIFAFPLPQILCGVSDLGTKIVYCAVRQAAMCIYRETGNPYGEHRGCE